MDAGAAMRQEIINPSDHATIDTTDRLSAALAVTVIGSGRYSIRSNEDENDSLNMPMFLFGGVDEWFMSEFGVTFEDALSQVDRIKVAEALESIQLSGERSSMNDIVGRAKSMAEAIREEAES